MSDTVTIGAVLPHHDRLLEAIETLKAKGHRSIDVMMPVPDHEILDALPMKPTKVNWLSSMWGAAFGVNLGLFFPAWAHWWIFQQITGGKPVVSWPPFGVPGFEMMILFTGIFTFIGTLLICRLPNRLGDPHFDPRATEDHYVLIVDSPAEGADEVRQILTAAGGEVQ